MASTVDPNVSNEQISGSITKSNALISPGMVQRIRKIFETDEEEEAAAYPILDAPIIEEKPKEQPRIIKRTSMFAGAIRSESYNPDSPTKSQLNCVVNRTKTNTPKSPRRSTTVQTDALLKLLRHYRALCKRAGADELSLCSELLEAEEPFIGMMDLEEPSSLAVSGDALSQIRKLPGNEVCADCGTEDNSWASTNLGVFICIRCSGVHRSLGVHITSILSCSLDVWAYNLIEAVSALGNNRVNDEYEYHLKQDAGDYLACKLKPLATDAERKLFIREKYVNKLFHRSTLDPDLTQYKLRIGQVNCSNVRSLSQTSLRKSNYGKKAMAEYSGIVFINLQQGTKIQKRKHLNSFVTHVYVSFSMGEQIVNSKKRKYTPKPKWNESVQFNLPMETEDCNLIVQLCGHSALKQREVYKLGEASINVREERFLEAPQNLELAIGDGTILLSVFVSDLNK